MEIVEVERNRWMLDVLTNDGNMLTVDVTSMSGPGCWYRVAQYLADRNISDPFGVYAAHLGFSCLYDAANGCLGETWCGPHFDHYAYEMGKYCAENGYDFPYWVTRINFEHVFHPETYLFSYERGWLAGGGKLP